jgi:hypothetical protein
MRAEGMHPQSRSALGYIRQHAHWILFFSILAIGVFARAWEFGRVPPGLNPDEASIAVEAYSLLHFGVDRNGMSYPVQFIAWGDGQSVPYAYLMMTGIALAGHLSPTIIRLPMLITGIISLPLVYLVGKWTVDHGLGLLGMFFLAISPWHILLSRWALDANLLPFSFLAGFACVLAGARSGRWFIAACAIFGLSLYTYATAYAVVPVFMALTLLVNWRTRAVGRLPVILGLSAFAVIAAPLALFILVNTARLNTMSLGPITIPRYPVTPRYETQTLIRTSDQSETWLTNLATAGGLLWTQSDGFVQNTVEPYGYFYKITFPLSLLGIIILANLVRQHAHAWEAALLLSWMAASLTMALFLPVNTNQFNIVFIPLIICIALGVSWLSSRLPMILPLSIFALTVAFIGFTLVYHGRAYRDAANTEFRAGILPALQYASQTSRGPICVSAASGQYIYILYLEHANPTSYLSSMKYDDPLSRERNVVSLGRYTFGVGNCTGSSAWTYVLSNSDNLPRLGNRYDYKFFDNYVVFYVKP